MNTETIPRAFRSLRKFFNDTWRIMSTADTAVSIWMWAGGIISISLPTLTATWAYIDDAPWPILVALFLFVFAVLLFIFFRIIIHLDYRKNKIEQKIREHYASSIQDEEKELLDYRYAWEQALEDMNKLLRNLAKEMRWIGKKIARYSFKLTLPIKFNKKYKLISNAGEDINLSAKKIKNYAEIMSDINLAIRVNFIKFIEKSPCKADKEKEELKTLISVCIDNKRSAKEFIEKLKHYRNTTKSLNGLSKHLTAACNEMYDGAGSLIREIRNFSETFDQLEKTIRQKLSRR